MQRSGLPGAKAQIRKARGRAIRDVSLEKLGAALARAAMHLVLIAGGITMLAPFVWMVSTSLKTRAETFVIPIRWIPHEFHFENYPRAFEMAPFGKFFLNSFYMAVSVTVGRLIICTMGAYAFSRLRWAGRDTVFLLYLATMMIPGQVTLIPRFLIIHWLHWMDTYQALIVPGLASAFGTFLLRQFFLSIPMELEDAARIDGCSRPRTILHVIVPLAKQPLAVLALFSFRGVWNAFLWPLLVTKSEDMRTVQVGLSYFKDQFYVIQWGEMMAGTTVVVLPVLIVYILAQRHLIEGISMTGIRG